MECQVPDVDGCGVDGAGVDGSGVDDGVDGSGVDDGVDDGVDGAGVDVGAGVGVFDDDGSAVAVSVSGAASDSPGTFFAVSRPLIEFLPWTESHPVTPVRFARLR